MGLYSIGQVAKRTGISARMLRHYDDIGLFVPAEVSANGYRWYRTSTLPRLYRIMALRRAGLGLSAIAEVVADESPEAGVLEGHLTELRAERQRLDTLITALEEHLSHLQDAEHDLGKSTPAELRQEREGFSMRLASGFGEAASFEVSEGDYATLSTADMEHMAATMSGIMKELAHLMNAGHAPTSIEAQDTVARHFKEVTRYWPMNSKIYAALGGLYVTDPLQKKIAAKADVNLPGWLAHAIHEFASRMEFPKRKPEMNPPI